MAEKWTVKTAESEEPKSVQETEAAVLEQAVDKGDVAPEYGVQEDGTTKVNIDAPPPEKPIEDEQKSEGKADDSKADEGGVEQQPESTESAEEQKEVPAEDETQESPIELVTDNQETESVPAAAATTEQQAQEIPQPQVELPENVEKLVAFMEETGGTVEDYVNLNKDLSTYDDESLIKEYYKQKNPRLSEERLARKMKKSFSYDEDLDDADVIQDKKDAFEDEVFAAKEYLEGNREKYYAELKLSKQKELDPQTRQAVEFYQQQQEVSNKNQQLTQTFHERTNKVFNEDFKGFDFKVGNDKYRYNVNNPDQVKKSQSDLNNFIQKFLGEDGSISDASGYHKALWAADNADALATHFYEQGRADAIKSRAAQAKGINMDPRKAQTTDDVRQSGQKVRVVDSGDSTKLRFKNYKNR